MSRVKLPGLVDVHTHMRVPGGEQKEDFATGTAAALAGGVVAVLAMPNTAPAITTPTVLAETYATAAATARCDVGLFAGASAEDVDHLPALGERAVALKIYLNDTFGKLRVDDVPTLAACFKNWPRHKPIALHAEKQSVAVAIGLAAIYDRPVHLCHISRQEEIELIADAKMRGLKVTCEVCPHHLFLNRDDGEKLGPYGNMRPVLGTPEDVKALWHHLNDTVDCIATDHAPHTIAEKESSNPPGVPGVQTMLPLMLTAVRDGKLSLDRLVEMMATNPRRIYGLAEPADTWVEVDMDATFTVRNEDQLSRCGWTPFDGWELTGRVEKVVLRGQTVFANGAVLAEPGSGQII